MKPSTTAIRITRPPQMAAGVTLFFHHTRTSILCVRTQSNETKVGELPEPLHGVTFPIQLQVEPKADALIVHVEYLGVRPTLRRVTWIGAASAENADLRFVPIESQIQDAIRYTTPLSFHVARHRERLRKMDRAAETAGEFFLELDKLTRKGGTYHTDSSAMNQALFPLVDSRAKGVHEQGVYCDSPAPASTSEGSKRLAGMLKGLIEASFGANGELDATACQLAFVKFAAGHFAFHDESIGRPDSVGFFHFAEAMFLFHDKGWPNPACDEVSNDAATDCRSTKSTDGYLQKTADAKQFWLQILQGVVPATEVFVTMAWGGGKRAAASYSWRHYPLRRAGQDPVFDMARVEETLRNYYNKPLIGIENLRARFGQIVKAALLDEVGEARVCP